MRVWDGSACPFTAEGLARQHRPPEAAAELARLQDARDRARGAPAALGPARRTTPASDAASLNAPEIGYPRLG